MLSKKTSGLAVTSTVPRTWWMPPSDRSNTYPLSNLIQTLGERKFEIFEITQRIWKRQENARKAKRPYAVRKTVGWHVNPETGKTVQEQITIIMRQPEQRGCKYWQSTTTIPLHQGILRQTARYCGLSFQNFVPSDFGMSMFCNKSRKKNQENRSFSWKRITFLSLAELRCATGGFEAVLG